MASTNIYAVPTENTAVNYELPQNESAKVQFGPADITGLRLADGGALVISLKEGGSVTFTNFQSFIDNGNTLTLADDTVVDPNLLFTALGGQNDNPFPDAADVVRIAVPEAGATTEVALQPGEKYLLNFDLSETQGADIKDGAMTISFENGGKIVIPNYEVAMAGEMPPELSLASKTCVVTGDQLITDIRNLAAAGAVEETVVVVEEEVEEGKRKSTVADADMQGNDDIGAGDETQLGYKAKSNEPAKKEDGEDVANVEPAAGDEMAEAAERLADIETAAGAAPGARNSGYGYGSTPGNDPFATNPDIGPLDPTALSYEAPIVEPAPAIINNAETGPNGIGPNVEILDETNLKNGPISEGGTIVVDFGADGPGGINPNGTFSSGGSQTGGNLSSNGSAVTVAVVGNSYVGTDANGVKVFELVVNSATGDYVFTQFQPLDHADGTNPNDEIQLNFGIVARDGDGDALTTSVNVIIKDDAPVANNDVNTYDTNLGTASGNVVTGLNGGAGAADVLSQDDSNKVVKIAFAGNEIDVPATGTVSIDGQYGKLTISADGSYTYDLFGNGGAGGTPTPMQFSGNNSPDFSSIDKTDEQASIGIAPGNLDFNAGDTVNLKVSYEGGSNNNSVGIFTVDADGNIKLEKVLIKDSETPGIVGQTFSHTLTEDASQFGLFMLADVQVNTSGLNFETGSLSFVYNYGQAGERGAKVTDNGGTITVVYTDANGVETALGQKIYFTNERGGDTSLNHDGLPHVSSGVLGGTNDSVLRVGFEDQHNQGDKDFNDLVIDMTVDKGDCGCGPKGDVRDEFVYTLKDGDGDIDKATLVLNGKDLIDDVPEVIVPDAEIVDETTLVSGVITETGKVDFDFGADGPGTFGGSGTFSSSGSQTGGALSHNGTAIVVTFENGVYTGKAGAVTIFTMTIADDGNYSFKLFENIDHADGTNPNDEITLNFGVVAIDCDEDKTEKNIVVKVRDDVPTISGSSGTVDETNLSATTPLVHTGNLTHNFGQDGKGQIIIGNASAFVAGGSLDNGVLSHNGSAITVTATATGYVGTTAGGEVAFTLTINKDTGSYEYKQFLSLDHADNNNANDEITLSFDAKIIDFDGDTAKAPIVITIRDDAPTFPPENPDNPNDPNDPDNPNDPDDPTDPNEPNDPNQPDPAQGYRIVDETNLPDNGGLTTTGKLNADFGADEPGTYAFVPNSFSSSGSKTGGNLTSNGVPVVVTFENGGYVGKAGTATVFTLTLNAATGTYTFTLLDTLDHADGNADNDIIHLDFGVEARDSEGDAATGKIRIDVKDDAPVANDDTITLTTNTASGNVTNNDAPGNDLPATVTKVTFNGTTYDVPTTGQLTITATYGTLKIGKDGAYTYTANGNTNGTDKFVYTLKDFDGDTDTAELSVKVDKDFTPEIIKPADEILDETNLSGGTLTETGAVTANFFGDGPGTFEGNNSFASSGSRLGNALTHNGTPVNVSYANGVYTGTAGGKTIFTMEIATDGKYTFKLFDNLDHANASDPNDIIKLDFGVIAKDKDGDTAGTTITVQVKDDAPTIGGGSGTVDETALSPTTPLVVGGNLANSFGQDGAGTLTIGNAAAFSASGSVKNNVLSSNGSVITVTATADGYVGKTAAGETAFTLKITSAGAYEYKQFLNLDHADANDPNDEIKLTFGAQIVDYDGDKAQSNIVITIRDDAPSLPPVIIKPGDEVVDETNLAGGALTEGGKIQANFYNGQTGTISGDGAFSSSGSKLNGALTHNGTPVNVTYANGTYTGKAGATTVFTLVVAANGDYTFKLLEQLDHNDPNDPNDIINLNFGVIATDPSGLTASTTVTVKVLDDQPVATNDSATLNSNNTATGNVTNNDNVGQDAPGTVTKIVYNGQTYNVPSSGDLTINGTYGTLKINKNGGYSYTAKDKVDGTDVFTYTLTDRDGDSATANLNVKVNNDNTIPQIITPAAELLDETNLVNGALTETGKINANFFADGPGTISGTGGFSAGGSLKNGGLYHAGSAVSVSYANGVYTGTAAGKTIFTLAIAADGNYTFRLYEQLDHANASDPNDTINLNFGIIARDTDGDTATNTLVVQVRDDAPVASPNFCTLYIGSSQTSIGSNALANDYSGQDNIGAYLNGVSYGGNHQAIGNGGSTVIQGTYGALTIYSNGEYSYQSKGNTSVPVTESFNYSYVDGDGDTVTAVLEFTHIKASEARHDGTQWYFQIDGSAGTDIISGSSYKDVIYGGAGNDQIYGAAGNDILYGQSGADTFVFKSISQGLDTVKDFSTGQGDKIDLSNIITNFDPVTHAINNFVFATHSGGNTIISVNNAGNGAGGATAVAVLEGVTVSVADLFNNGSIVH